MIIKAKTEILPEAQQELWPLLNEVPSDFVLYGGTAVALRYGHRQSVDFDFFSSMKDTDILNTTGKLDFIKKYAINYEAPDISIAESGSQVIYDLKMSNGEKIEVTFVRDKDFINGSVEKPSQAIGNRINIASSIDLMATKINALKNRRSVKDFVDISTMIKNGVSFKRGITVAIALNKSNLIDEIEIFNHMLQALREPESYSVFFKRDMEAPSELTAMLPDVVKTIVPEAERISLEKINYNLKLRSGLSYEIDREGWEL